MSASTESAPCTRVIQQQLQGAKLTPFLKIKDSHQVRSPAQVQRPHPAQKKATCSFQVMINSLDSTTGSLSLRGSSKPQMNWKKSGSRISRSNNSKYPPSLSITSLPTLFTVWAGEETTAPPVLVPIIVKVEHCTQKKIRFNDWGRQLKGTDSGRSDRYQAYHQFTSRSHGWTSFSSAV